MARQRRHVGRGFSLPKSLSSLLPNWMATQKQKDKRMYDRMVKRIKTQGIRVKVPPFEKFHQQKIRQRKIAKKAGLL